MAAIRTNTVFDVAIAGCGPVGATLACLLGRQGLRVLVLDKAPAVYPQPRAVGFDQDAMRIFQRAGVAQALAPHIAPFRNAEYLGVGGRVIQRVRHVEPPYPLAWRPNYACDQPGVEAVLREALAGMAGVQLLFGHELVAASEEGAQVRLQVRDAAGRAGDWSARYLVGCDGASSPLRRALGIGLQSLDYDEPWIAVDMEVDEAHLPRLPATNVQYCDPVRPCTHVVCPGRHRRWEFMLLAGEQPEGAVEEARLWQLLAPWLAPGQARIRRAAAYRFHALIAREWRRGRILLAGDSAHQTPPFMGQGMCQGIRDAGNLAWKLALAVRGEAADGLLDTYFEERAPHVAATTRLAKDLGRLISERDPVRALARDEALLAQGGGSAPTVVRQQMIPGLAAGLVAHGSPRAGEVFPQAEVATAGGETCLLDDLAGPAFRFVVADGRPRRALAELQHAAACWGLPVVHVGRHTDGALDSNGGVLAAAESDAVVADWLARAGAWGALVRPDHHAFGCFADLAGARALAGQLLPRVFADARAGQPAASLRSNQAIRPTPSTTLLPS